MKIQLLPQALQYYIIIINISSIMWEIISFKAKTNTLLLCFTAGKVYQVLPFIISV